MEIKSFMNNKKNDDDREKRLRGSLPEINK